MRRPLRRAGMRAALDAAAIPTFNGPRQMAGSAEAIRFMRAPGRLPAGRRVYAVGDIHGCRDKLVALHALIAADIAARPTRTTLLVHLGDYIDQGPDSAGVLTVLTAAPAVQVVNLLGDHERMLLDALDGDRAAATDWLWAGGKEALASWGLDPDLPREAWEVALPPQHVAFLRSLVLTHREGGYLFVHAGIRPGMELTDQSRDDLTTMRQPFLSSEQDHGFVVVHGHSSSPSVPILGNRIGLDTGAGIGGRLTCAVLEDDLVGLLAV
ncbi:metallophosphoesterase [Acidisphaera sp. S103]|uniref:metallophosphoesterase n=1 Tax=Acidisphaera sp. S103 TaxID=1747223 RepID=UPI0020B1419F|nr:metallophosphoesterase [Acidisphaera sp. S103]